MRDLIPEWIANYEDIQEMPLELINEIEDLLERDPDNVDALDVKKFLEERYATMQREIDRLNEASGSGSKVLLMNDYERAGWDARVEAERLEIARAAERLGQPKRSSGGVE